jgi:hypothetical protein
MNRVEKDRRRRGASAMEGEWKVADLTGSLAHDVSHLPGVGRHLGW